MTVAASITAYNANNDKDKTSVSISYIIADSAGAINTHTEALTAMPALSDTHTVSTIALKCRSRSVSVVDDTQARVWKGEAVFDDSGEDADWVASDLATTVATVDVWRVGATPPSSFSAPTEVDIGGTKVDSGGEPVSFLLPQQELTVTNFRSTNNAGNCIAGVGKRNTSAIMGAAAGYVLFAGATARRLKPNKYQIEYKFIYDTDAHLRQMPVKDVSGDITRGTVTANGWQAKTVFWKQPLPNHTDFTNLSITFP